MYTLGSHAQNDFNSSLAMNSRNRNTWLANGEFVAGPWRGYGDVVFCTLFGEKSRISLSFRGSR